MRGERRDRDRNVRNKWRKKKQAREREEIKSGY